MFRPSSKDRVCSRGRFPSEEGVCFSKIIDVRVGCLAFGSEGANPVLLDVSAKQDPKHLSIERVSDNRVGNAGVSEVFLTLDLDISYFG